MLVLGAGFEFSDTAVADPNGVATIVFAIPESADPGPATVTFSGVDVTGVERTATTTLTIRLDTGVAPEPQGGLGITGATLSNGLLLAIGIALAGGALVVAERRRQHDVAEDVQ